MLRQILESSNWKFSKNNPGYSGAPTISWGDFDNRFSVDIGYDKGFDGKGAFFASVIFANDDPEERADWIKRYEKNGFEDLIGDQETYVELSFADEKLGNVIKALKKTFGIAPSKKDLQPLIEEVVGI